jgi:predicted O-methyltransferase YrrM
MIIQSKKIRALVANLLPKICKEAIKFFYWKITNNYKTNKVLGSREKYLQIFADAKQETFINVDNYIQKNNFKNIDINFLNNLALTTQISIKKSKINYQHGKIIYALVYNYISQTKNIIPQYNFIDIGTAKGFSSIIIAKACIDNAVNFKIQTYDIIPNDVKMYWNSIEDLGGKKTRPELLNNFIKYLKNINYFSGKTKDTLKLSDNKRINFAFIDGSHDYDDVLFEYQFIKERQKEGDIIMFDDVTEGYFNGIVKLIHELRRINDYKIEFLTSSKERGYAIAVKK